MSVVAISLETLGDKSGVETVGTAANVSVVSTPTKLSDYSIEVSNATTGIGGALIRGRSAAWAGVDLSLPDFYGGFHYSPTLPAANYEYCAAILNVSGGRKLYLAQNADGTLSVYNPSNVLVATTTQVLTAGTWYWISFYVGTTVGTSAYELKINGVSALSGTVSMTASNGASLFLGKYTNINGQTTKFNYANAVIDNAAHPSEGYHKYAAPTNNGTYTSWAGTYVDVDERPPNTTDYALSTSTTGDAETANIADASTLRINSGDTIRCVAPIIAVRRDGTTNGAVLGRFRSTSNFDGSSSATTNAYVGLAQFYATDPNTSAAWADTGFNAVEVGVIENNANKSRMTTAGAIVNFQINTATVKVPRALLSSGKYI